MRNLGGVMRLEEESSTLSAEHQGQLLKDAS